MSTVVFLGPSLPIAEAARIFDATYLPPAAMGDVYRAALLRPRRIAIIDGYFERMAAPWHKEILWALERGIAMYGAASMGALRAVELEPFGMIGVGEIARAYRAGEITDDEEVAIVHGPAEHGYVAVSEATVNVRAALALAERRGIVSGKTARALLAIAKAQFYRDRTWESVLGAGRGAGLPSKQLTGLERLIARERPDAKAKDARTLLRRLAREPARRPRRRPTLARTWFWWRFVEAVED